MPLSTVNCSCIVFVPSGAASALNSVEIFGEGAAGLTKTGGGNMVLTGTNAYSGPTTVTGGTLTVSPAAIPANNAVAVTGGDSSVADGGGYRFP